VVDLRIYRAAFLATVLAVLVVMFSIGERPAPLSAPIAPDAFEGQVAYGETARLVKLFPERPPGGAGDDALGTFVERRFHSLGFETSRDRFHGQFKGDEVPLSNVVGLLNAPSDRQVVVMAPRDAVGRPGASSASSTAVLLQLASALDGSSRRKTFVFVSLDGSAAGGAGAERFAEHYPDLEKVDAVLVVDDIGAVAARRPYVVPWSTNSLRSSLQVVRTAEAALGRESDTPAGTDSWPAQFLRQAWPLTLRDQGPLVANGLDAITITSRGEVPRGDGADPLTGILSERLQIFGRSAFGAALAYDGTRKLEQSPRRYLVLGSKVIPDWAIALLAVCLVLPAVIASFDAFARARRRRMPVGDWVRWTLAASVPFVLALALAFLFEALGWLPESVAAALSPATSPSGGEAFLPLFVILVCFAGGWVFARPVLGRHLEGHSAALGLAAPAAAVALALVLSVEVLAICIVDPFTALMLVPAAHLCVVAALPERPRRGLIAGGILTAALLLPVLALAYYGARLDLGGDLIAYALLLVGSATASVWTAALSALLAGTLTSAAIVCLARAPIEDFDEPVTVRGPVTYAGPGSLGGTESALRR
jgi:peptidase M28-like protein